MTNVAIHRRSFLAAAGGAVGGAALASLAMGQDDDDGERPPAPIRKNIADLKPTGPELTKFRRAVGTLKERSEQNRDDRTGWQYLASLHGGGPGGCEHFNWWFLPWHRAYLRCFERMLQDAIGDESLTIPYWDWSTLPEVPAAMWGDDNPLYHPGRVAREGVAFNIPELSPPIVGQLMTVPDFATFGGVSMGGGTLEVQPHNLVHMLVGGDMSQVPRAAFDPVFLLHHCNVDRLWEHWLTADAGHQNPAQPLWLNRDFTFPNPRGEDEVITAAEVLSTFDLHYRYDDVPLPAQMSSAEIGGELTESPTTVKIENSIGFRQTFAAPRTLQSIRALEHADRRVRAVQLRVERLEVPEKPNVLVRIFINKPDAIAETSIKDIHYAGYFTFFGGTGHAEHHEHRHGLPSALLDVTPTVRRLTAARGLTDEGLEVTLVPVPIHGERADTRVKFQRIRLSTLD